MNIIEHIIEPTKLLLAWRSSDEQCGTRYIVGELHCIDREVTLTYLTGTKDFTNSQAKGFSGYPAFQDISIVHHNVENAFMRRLPPRSRGDFPQYLEGLRLKSDAQLSNFALLGYSGAKLPTDGFSIVHPFEKVDSSCELLVEATGYREILSDLGAAINIGDSALFTKEYNNTVQEEAICITVNEKSIGYVTRALIPAFQQWLSDGRIEGAWVEKTNGAPGKPTIYLFVKISSK